MFICVKLLFSLIFFFIFFVGFVGGALLGFWLCTVLATIFVGCLLVNFSLFSLDFIQKAKNGIRTAQHRIYINGLFIKTFRLAAKDIFVVCKYKDNTTSYCRSPLRMHMYESILKGTSSRSHVDILLQHKTEYVSPYGVPSASH